MTVVQPSILGLNVGLTSNVGSNSRVAGGPESRPDVGQRMPHQNTPDAERPRLCVTSVQYAYFGARVEWNLRCSVPS